MRHFIESFLFIALFHQLVLAQGPETWHRNRTVRHIYQARDDVNALGKAYTSGSLDIESQNADIIASYLTLSIHQLQLRFNEAFDWQLQWISVAEGNWSTLASRQPVSYMYVPINAKSVPEEQYIRDSNGERITLDVSASAWPDSDKYKAHQTVKSHVLRSALLADLLPLEVDMFSLGRPLFWPADMPMIRANCWTYALFVMANTLLTKQEKKDFMMVSRAFSHSEVMANQYFPGRNSFAIEELWMQALDINPMHSLVDPERLDDVPTGSLLFLWHQDDIENGLRLSRPNFEKYQPRHVMIAMDPSFCHRKEELLCAADLRMRDKTMAEKHENTLTDFPQEAYVLKEDVRTMIWTYTTSNKSMKAKTIEMWDSR